MNNAQTKNDKIRSKFNQAKAAHERLHTLFSLLHEYSLNNQYDSTLNVLYRVLAEASSVLTEEEYQSCKDKIDSCSDWESKVNRSSVDKDFLEAEKALRMKLQEHGMMMKEVSEDNGSALGAP